MGLLTGLIRGGLTAAGGAQSGAIAGEQQNYQRQQTELNRQRQMEELARQEALTNAQIEQDKAHALYYEGRNAVTAKHYQDQIRIDQQKADDLRARNTALAQQHQADIANRDQQAELNRKAAWDRTMAEIKGRQKDQAVEKPGETRQQYLSKRIPQLMKPPKPGTADNMFQTIPGTSLQDAAKQANAEYDTISGQQSATQATDTPAATPPGPDPRIGQLHAQAAAALQAGADPAQVIARLHTQTQQMTGSPVFNAAPVKGSAPGSQPVPGAPPPAMAAKPISPIQPPIPGAAPAPPPAVPPVAPPLVADEEAEDEAGTAD